jgi:hypothetical protein
MFEPAMKNSKATHVDFGFLRGLIESNPKAMPCNIDMVFERKGHFLFGEWKRPNETMKLGQEILLSNLAKYEMNTVLVIEGDTDNNEVRITDVCVINKYGMYKRVGYSVESFKKFLNEWYQKVNGES